MSVTEESFGPPPDVADEIKGRRGGTGGSTRARRVLTQVEIEQEIQRLSTEYEDAVDELDSIGRRTANSEADWKFKFWRAMTVVTDERPRSNKEWREASSALRAGEETYRKLKVDEAIERAIQEKCRSLKTRINALQTLAANVRAQT